MIAGKTPPKDNLRVPRRSVLTWSWTASARRGAFEVRNLPAGKVAFSRPSATTTRQDMTVLSPGREDDAGSNATAYEALLATTRSVSAAASGTAGRCAFSRNPNGNGANPRITGSGLEFHAVSSSGLNAGDAIPALYWHPAFNGGPRTTRPDQRGELKPFSQIRDADLVGLLEAR